jgi:mono/diheme cytochrome c family protein
LAGGLVVAALGAGWLMLSDNALLADRPDPEVMALGETVYTGSCAKCHGVDLKGEFGEMSAELIKLNEEANARRGDSKVTQIAPPHDISGGTWQLGDAKLFEVIKFGGEALDGGSSRMPAFSGSLTDAEIVAVIAYMKQFWPGRG